MYKFLLISTALCLSQIVHAQSPLDYHNLQINVGAEISDRFTPFYAGVDYGLDEVFTVGAQLSAASEYFGLRTNANYHFDNALDLSPKTNFYGGVMLGFLTIEDRSGYDIGVQFGGRQFVSDNFGINAEVSYAKVDPFFKFGLTYAIDSKYY